jgi:hypothetical protein
MAGGLGGAGAGAGLERVWWCGCGVGVGDGGATVEGMAKLVFDEGWGDGIESGILAVFGCVGKDMGTGMAYGGGAGAATGETDGAGQE